MIANNTPWQAVVNPNNLAAMTSMENKMAAVKKNTVDTKLVSVKMKVVNPKRYSFDDNGGGYKGL